MRSGDKENKQSNRGPLRTEMIQCHELRSIINTNTCTLSPKKKKLRKRKIKGRENTFLSLQPFLALSFPYCAGCYVKGRNAFISSLASFPLSIAPNKEI